MERNATSDEYIGASYLQYWYGRNLNIDTNITRLAPPGDCILVLTGAGHIPYLRQNAEQSNFFAVADTLGCLQPGF